MSGAAWKASDLIGATVTSALDGRGWGSDLGIEDAPVLVLRLPDGRRFVAAAWKDEEGNGPGYLAIDPWNGPELSA